MQFEGFCAARRMWTVCVAAFAYTIASPAFVDAQTRFAWPERATDLSRYATVDACLAATTRIGDSVNAPRRLALAIAPPTRSEVLSLPPEVIDAARRCSAQWSAATVALTDYSLLLPLYLQAGRDADARQLVTRRLAAVPMHDDSAMAALLDSTAKIYIAAVPLRIADVEALLAAYARLPGTTFRIFGRVGLLSALVGAADRSGDTLHARLAAEQVVQLAQDVSDVDKHTTAWVELEVYQVARAIDYLSRFSQLDSLRRSTAGYVALVRANWARAGATPDSPIGEHAKALVGEFWFAPGTRHAVPPSVRPKPGALSLITFLDDCSSRTLQCLGTYASLQRIHQQFPDVELTIVTQTFGFFFDQEPPTPGEEAELYRRWWLEARQLPATLVVAQTPFTRMPAPDRRRMNQLTANQINYSFGQRWKVSSRMSFLVDRDGIIIEAAALDRDNEPRFDQLLKALRDRVPINTP